MRRVSLPLRPMPSACLLLSIAVILAGYGLRPTKAQDTPPPPPVATPTEVLDQIMTLIGQGRIDDGVSMMEGLKSQLDLRQDARSRLLRLHNDEGTYRGYDVAAIQRFTGQFQTVDVLAYYDQQPVLLRFHFYRPQIQDGVKWNVLGFRVVTDLAEITDLLKDTPVDYVGRKK
jgi:hypothetical protein